MATSELITTRPAPVQKAMAEMSCHALWSSCSERSFWNTGMMSVTSVYSSTAATEFTIMSALTNASVTAEVP